MFAFFFVRCYMENWISPNYGRIIDETSSFVFFFFFSREPFVISLQGVSPDFAITEEMGVQLHLAATNRHSVDGENPKGDGKATTPEAQYQVPRTVIQNGYGEIVYSSRD